MSFGAQFIAFGIEFPDLAIVLDGDPARCFALRFFIFSSCARKNRQCAIKYRTSSRKSIVELCRCHLLSKAEINII